MSSYQITEPHPHVGTYMHAGRGGAGNAFRAPVTTDASNARGPASLFGSKLPQTSTKFSAGRGGAGNIHDSSERAVFSFDEELERQAARDSKPTVYHVGRGGAGNWAATKPQSSSSRKDSSSSDESERSGFFNRISHTFERR